MKACEFIFDACDEGCFNFRLGIDRYATTKFNIVLSDSEIADWVDVEIRYRAWQKRFVLEANAILASMYGGRLLDLVLLGEAE